MSLLTVTHHIATEIPSRYRVVVVAKRSSPKSPFGRESRREILTRHFAQHPVTIARAWEFVYRELLWIDGSTGLAHLYESDKAQPGRSLWYQRSITFTNWLCEHLGAADRAALKGKIDWLFKACLEKLVESKQADAELIEAVAE